MPKNMYNGVDSDAVSFIAYKAKKLTHSPFFTSDDYDDLCQELTLDFLLAWPNFDPSKGDRRSFIKAVVNNYAAELIDKAKAKKRWMGTKVLSLSSLLSEEGNLEVVDVISNEQHLWQDPFSSHHPLAVEQQLDIEKWLSEMPAHLREIYELLKDQSVLEAALKIGAPRTTLVSRLKKLREYLKKKREEK